MQGLPNMIYEPFPHQCYACISCLSLGNLRFRFCLPRSSSIRWIL